MRTPGMVMKMIHEAREKGYPPEAHAILHKWLAHELSPQERAVFILAVEWCHAWECITAAVVEDTLETSHSNAAQVLNRLHGYGLLTREMRRLTFGREYDYYSPYFQNAEEFK